MKYRILTVLLVLLALFSLSVSAASYEYSISPGDDFTAAQHGDDLTEISQKLNMSVDDLNTYFNKNGILYIAISDDAKTQVRLSAFTDNFSSLANDISYLNDDALNEFISAVSEDGENNCKIIVNNNRKFIVVKDTLKDSGGVYTVTQYITICNSKTFYLSCYNSGEDTSEQIDSVFKSLTINSIQTNKNNDNTVLIFIALGILILSTISVVMIIGIIKNFTVKKNKNKQSALL